MSVGVVGLAFAAAMARLLAGAARRGVCRWRSLRRIRTFVVIFGWQIGAGISMIAGHYTSGSVQTLDYVLVGSMAAAIFRAGVLVGLRDTGLFASLTLARGEAAAPSDSPPSD